jgi:hydrogenase nickel incorporation protein HypB
LKEIRRNKALKVNVGERILGKHEELTAQNRELLQAHGILTINIMGSPGAGKTSVLERIIAKMKSRVRMAVIEGDLFTSKDAERIMAQGVPVVQINTRGACHLDGNMIRDALQQLPLAELDLLIIENIGNLVCPAEFDLGEDLRISLLSVAEGEDKVPKYPLMFKDVAAVILNKIDLLPYTNFDIVTFYQDVLKLNPAAAIFEISCRIDSGLEAFITWLHKKIETQKEKGV